MYCVRSVGYSPEADVYRKKIRISAAIGVHPSFNNFLYPTVCIGCTCNSRANKAEYVLARAYGGTELQLH